MLGKSGPGLTESALKKLNRMNNEASSPSLRPKGGSETDDGRLYIKNNYFGKFLVTIKQYHVNNGKC